MQYFNRIRLYLFALLFVLIQSQLLAHGEDKGISGTVTRADWVDRIPIVIVCILIVVAVDAVFIVPIIRKLRTGEQPAATTEED